jgi:hypothetical protein
MYGIFSFSEAARFIVAVPLTTGNLLTTGTVIKLVEFSVALSDTSMVPLNGSEPAWFMKTLMMVIV